MGSNLLKVFFFSRFIHSFLHSLQQSFCYENTSPHEHVYATSVRVFCRLSNQMGQNVPKL